MNETTNTGFGHNSGDLSESADPFTQTQTRVDALIANADRWLKERPKITDDDLAGKCSDFIEQLTKQAKAVDEDRLAANRPLRDAITENDKRFKPLVDRLETAKKLLKARLTPWLQEKERRRLEAVRKAEEEALEKMRAAEEARKAADQATTVDDVVRAEEARKAADQAIKDATAVSKSKANVQGEFGSRARGLRTVWSAAITDYDAALNHYRNTPQVRDLIQRLADADARSPERRSVAVPGVEFTERQEAA